MYPFSSDLKLSITPNYHATNPELHELFKKLTVLTVVSGELVTLGMYSAIDYMSHVPEIFATLLGEQRMACIHAVH